mmetsp:Transcript_6241/g.15444  ORF Transcript_6241/g.15444 Transcript_6241/m.15444 type:complete len:107 (+) Transcript_6241:1169-1489(+)
MSFCSLCVSTAKKTEEYPSKRHQQRWLFWFNTRLSYVINTSLVHTVMYESSAKANGILTLSIVSLVNIEASRLRWVTFRESMMPRITNTYLATQEVEGSLTTNRNK